MPKDDDLVTISFIAASLRVSRQTAWRWVAQRKIRATAIKVGSRTVYRIRYSEYRAFLERFVRGEDD
jgi:excisionase family DNA binding protein